MKIAIMQPYFLPYIGYFQLIDAVDTFIIYDNIKYTKKGWINRNRFLVNGSDALFSLPLKKDSDLLDVRDREISGDFDRKKLLNRFAGAYAKAPEFQHALEEITKIVSCPETNLFKFIFSSVQRVCAYLNIKTPIVVSSEIPIDHANLRAQDKVIALCKALGGTHYINPIGGVGLYDKTEFGRHGLELSFQKTGNDVIYPQFDNVFVPSLSILDVMMFNRTEQIQSFLKLYSLSAGLTK